MLGNRAAPSARQVGRGSGDLYSEQARPRRGGKRSARERTDGEAASPEGGGGTGGVAADVTVPGFILFIAACRSLSVMRALMSSLCCRRAASSSSAVPPPDALGPATGPDGCCAASTLATAATAAGAGSGTDGAPAQVGAAPGLAPAGAAVVGEEGAAAAMGG